MGIREDVAVAIANYDDAHYAERDNWEPGTNSYDSEPEFHDDYQAMADAAITAVIEALAAEAEAEPFMDFTGDWEWSSSQGFADWLRGHLGGTEVTE